MKEPELQPWSPRQQLLVASSPEMSDLVNCEHLYLSYHWITGNRKTDLREFYSLRSMSISILLKV